MGKYLNNGLGMAGATYYAAGDEDEDPAIFWGGQGEGINSPEEHTTFNMWSERKIAQVRTVHIGLMDTSVQAAGIEFHTEGLGGADGNASHSIYAGGANPSLAITNHLNNASAYILLESDNYVKVVQQGSLGLIMSFLNTTNTIGSIITTDSDLYIAATSTLYLAGGADTRISSNDFYVDAGDLFVVAGDVQVTAGFLEFFANETGLLTGGSTAKIYATTTAVVSPHESFDPLDSWHV